MEKLILKKQKRKTPYNARVNLRTDYETYTLISELSSKTNISMFELTKTIIAYAMENIEIVEGNTND